MLKVGQMLTVNLNFPGHLSTLRAENAPSRPVKAKESAQVLNKELQTKFKKV